MNTNSKCKESDRQVETDNNIPVDDIKKTIFSKLKKVILEDEVDTSYIREPVEGEGNSLI